MNSGNKLFGKRIKELRESKKYTQEQLAEKIGLEYQTISRIETGYYFTGYENLEKLANALEVNMSDLFDYGHFNDNLENQIIDIVKSMDTKSLEFALKFLKALSQYKK
ncbi:helix-turn-helix transcriptional regulator [bacterium]|nr:helix-turn-helix transcriptional regulator [bacterium]